MCSRCCAIRSSAMATRLATSASESWMLTIGYSLGAFAARLRACVPFAFPIPHHLSDDCKRGRGKCAVAVWYRWRSGKCSPFLGRAAKAQLLRLLTAVLGKREEIVLLQRFFLNAGLKPASAAAPPAHPGPDLLSFAPLPLPSPF